MASTIRSISWRTVPPAAPGSAARPSLAESGRDYDLRSHYFREGASRQEAGQPALGGVSGAGRPTIGGVSGMAILAHQGGWDEMLMVAGPLLGLVALLAVAHRRARGSTGAGSEPAGPEPGAGDPG